METCFNYCYERGDNDNIGWFSSDEQKWINRIRKLKEQYPDDVIIRVEPETNDGCIYCKVPQSWLKISPPRKLELTDEQIAQRKEQAMKNLAKINSGKK